MAKHTLNFSRKMIENRSNKMEKYEGNVTFIYHSISAEEEHAADIMSVWHERRQEDGLHS